MNQMESATGGRMLAGQTTGSEMADQGPTVVASYTDVTNPDSFGTAEQKLQAEADRRNRNDGTRDELTYAAFPQALKDRPSGSAGSGPSGRARTETHPS